MGLEMEDLAVGMKLYLKPEVFEELKRQRKNGKHTRRGWFVPIELINDARNGIPWQIEEVYQPSNVRVRSTATSHMKIGHFHFVRDLFDVVFEIEGVVEL